jgi:DNA polymerase III delta subunit
VYYKNLKKIEGFEEFKDPDPSNLHGWLMSQAKMLGANISHVDATYLIDRVGANQTLLAHEVEKLAQYDLRISRANIDLLTEQTPSSTVFNLIDSAFSGNLALALKLYDEQRAQKVEPQAVHGMLVWQMNIVAVCATAGNKNSHEIATETKLNPYVVGKSQNIARRMGREKISEFLKLLRDIDYASKHKTYDYDQAMRYAIVSLAN